MTQPVCQYLRTKSCYTADRTDRTLTEASPGAQYWCLRSMAPIGPDDRLVGPNECTGQRACFDTVDIVFA
jgi:hypothetical protein